MVGHRFGFYTIIVIACLLFFANLAINIAAALNRFGITNQILPTDILEVQASFPLDYDVSPWYQVFRILVVVWEFFFICYAFSTLCRVNFSTRNFLYHSPQYLPITGYAMFGAAMLCGMAWVFAWSYQLVGYAFAFQFVEAFALSMSVYLFGYGLYHHTPSLASAGHEREVHMARGLVLNGIAMHAGWADFMAMLTLIKTLIYRFEIDDTIAGIIVLAIYLAGILIFFILEITVLDRYLRYSLLYYPVILIGAVSCFMNSVGEEGAPLTATNYLFIFIMAVSAMAVLGKILNICMRPDPSSYRK